MSETIIEAEAVGGRVDARLFLPEGEGPWPLVVFYPDAAGLRHTLSRMGERLAEGGYAVVQPNPFWRSGPYAPFDPQTVFRDPSERARLLALVATVEPEAAVSDTKALVASLERDPRVGRGPLGVLGYCMGGRLAFLTAAEWPERVAAAASIHGGGLVSEGDDSPHLAAHRIRAALYLAVADHDRTCTRAHQQALRAALDEAGVSYELELYPGASHGFAVPDFPVYDEEASARHWAQILRLLGRHLKRN